MFTKEKSSIVKGCAIIMMLFHHNFLSGRFEMYDISFCPISELSATHIASFFKICVSLFAFISGYGLYHSYDSYISGKGNRINTGKWVIHRLVKTLSGYWFVLILSWIICMAIDGFPVRAYSFDTSSKLYGCWNVLIEFLGLSNLVGRSPMNGTWWYMSAAVAYVMLVPLLYSSLKGIGACGTMFLVFIIPRIMQTYPGDTSFVSFMLAFAFGMAFADGCFFETWKERQENLSTIEKILKFICSTAVLLVVYKIYYRLPTNQYWDIKWGIMPIFVIVYINDYVAEIPGLRSCLAFLGKHATNIFLTHTFIRHYYAKDFIYSFGHCLVIMGVLLLISLVMSFAIEALKKLVRYDSLINKMCLCLTK